MTRQRRRVLITGASGFLGSRLLKTVAATGADCFALTRSAAPKFPAQTTALTADCRDIDAVRSAFAIAKPDVVYHCAMTSGHPASAEGRLESLSTSVLGTANLLEAALAYETRRFLFTGSFLTYSPQPRPLLETDPIAPFGFRGSAKAAASHWVSQFASHTGLPTVELRIFSVYGPGEPARRFIPTLLRAARDGAALPLLSGPRHDFIYVDDVVSACIQAAETDAAPGSIFNVGSGKTWSNEAVVALAREVTGRPITVIENGYPAGPADAENWQADISAARLELGWAPDFNLESGLAEMYRVL